MSGITKRLLLAIAMFFAAGVLYSAPAAAQATRTWVSGVGDDANPCSRTAPCKTFAGAFSKTAAGGEINCLDPGGFGALTIIKSITIDCTGTFGSVLASSTTGFIVNGANVDVILRGLSINGAPPTAPGVNGIRVLSANTVLIERVTITGFLGAVPNGFGIMINPSGTSTPSVTVIDSTISNSSNGGIGVVPAAATTVTLSVYNTKLLNNAGNGILVNTASGASTVKVKVANSLISGANNPSATGFAFKGSLGTVTGSISGSTIVDNSGFGVRITMGTLFVGTSTISGNGTGVDVAGGTMTSYGNNQVNNNGANGSFSGTTPTS